jgi:hypothetical protein
VFEALFILIRSKIMRKQLPTNSFNYQNKMSSKIIVPRNARDANGSCQKEGLSAEEAFKERVAERGGVWRNANREENIFKHIDCFVDGKAFDIKAAKRIARRNRRGMKGLVQDALHWVEHIGITGHPGWTHATHMDYLAFQMLNKTFIVVNRSVLSSFLDDRVAFQGGKCAKSQYTAKDGVLWRRKGRRDAMTLFSTDQLLALEGTEVW